MIDWTLVSAVDLTFPSHNPELDDLQVHLQRKTMPTIEAGVVQVAIHNQMPEYRMARGFVSVANVLGVGNQIVKILQRDLSENELQTLFDVMYGLADCNDNRVK